ncbi:metallophosphoesterase family protein [Paenibacillus sp. alder61]|uniref:metallophosphoesterase family protein n=1 Tax=Paenibacillus sp. alder61 TaxID=2862948 RepID=UPI001CD66CEA|nr:metallophosphoesterase family protein [Paenibacillus sp. alder61]MCA1296529.1 metallophosphoesterase family protein [Paenibacillus sp. alder61]
MSQRLTFREDGTFTIVQFTDLHWKDGNEIDQRTRALMELVMEEERPDLVVFTGDVVYTGPSPDGIAKCENPSQALREAVAAVEEREIPWALVFGNHDTEQGITREELMQVVTEHRHTLAVPGPADLPGVGNYVLELADQSGQPAANLYFLDSGSYSSHENIPGYGWVTREQIQWLTAESARLNPPEAAVKTPALAFFHIPIPEYQELWDKQVCYGHKYEPVCSPQINSGLFAALVEMGDVMGTFCGHDHVNDYWGVLHGIRLCYGRASGFHTYGREGFPRGARVIQLTAGARGFDTWLRLEDGSAVHEQPEHRPESMPQ